MTNTQPQPPHQNLRSYAESTASHAPDAGEIPCLCSASLLGRRSSIAIDHAGTRYILRTTRAGKLILTK